MNLLIARALRTISAYTYKNELNSTFKLIMQRCLVPIEEVPVRIAVYTILQFDISTMYNLYEVSQYLNEALHDKPVPRDKL